MDISLPDNWKAIAAGLGAMVALAGLDFIGAICAKEWAERGRLIMFAAGLAAFVVLFVVYARILKVAELSTVTIGWVVFLQVGLILLDGVHYDVQMPRGKIAAVVAIIVLQVYLIAAPNGPDTQEIQATSAPADHGGQHPTGQKPAESDATGRRAGRPLGPKAARSVL
jgi:hypothetical protein